MARIKGRETRPEVILRKGLHALGYRYRLHLSKLPGKPDIVLRKHRAVIFAHGCFWHRHEGCHLSYKPKSNMIFWAEKFSENVARDRRQIQALMNTGWRVLLVWECALRPEKERAAAIRAAARWIESRSAYAEISGSQ